MQVFYDNESYNFDVPKRPGDLWTVFDFDNSTREDKVLKTGFKEINRFNYQPSPENIDNY